MEIKTLVRLTALTISCGLAYNLICLGEMGIARYRVLQQEVAEQNAKVAQLSAQVQDLHTELHSWHTDQFRLEKHAREELLMGGSNEVVYLVK